MWHGGVPRGRADEWLLLARLYMRARRVATSSPLWLAGVLGAAFCEQRARRRACEAHFISLTVAGDDSGDIPLQASSPLTTRRRCHPQRRCAWRVRRLPMTLYESRSRLWRPCFPRAQHKAWGRVLVPVAPRLMQSPEGCRSGAPTPGPSHLL